MKCLVQMTHPKHCSSQIILKFKDKIFPRSVLSKAFIGHLGRHRVSKSVKESFYWIGIDNDVR